MMNGHFFCRVLTSFSQLQNKSFARPGKDVYIRLINVQTMKKGTYKTCKTTSVLSFRNLQIWDVLVVVVVLIV